MGNKGKQNKKITEQEFINKAKLIHKNKNYDYSLVKFELYNYKVKIICNIHGEFIQRYTKHLLGHGCPKCGGRYRTTEEFIKKAEAFHHPRNHFYDYSNTKYTNYSGFITFGCPIHGLVEQRACDHLRCGCRFCSKTIKKDTEQFIKLSKQIHGDLYDYTSSIYENSNKKIKIICKKHGEFWQKPTSHLSGKKGFCCTGTPKLTKEQFIKKAQECHLQDQYDYSNIIYLGAHKKIQIKCLTHGFFWQTPSNHLQPNFCPDCVCKTSRAETDFLNALNIPDNYRQIKVFIGNRKFLCDAADLKNKIIIEFNGDHWHGNPEYFDQNKIVDSKGGTYGDRYRKTLWKKNLLEKHGYTVVSVWESWWYKIKKQYNL